MTAPSTPLVLALDQGGHASRAVVYDLTGAALARAEVPIATSEPAPDRVEHDADAVAASVLDAARAAVAAIGPDAARIASAGLATQRSSIVCWDRTTGAALSPILSWRDRRAADALGDGGSAGGRRRIRALTGLVPNPHAGATKLRWCLDALPAVTDAARTGRLACGPLASFLLARLLRERPLLADAVNASRTLLYDIRRGNWAPELLERFGVPDGVLPVCVPDVHPFGTLALDAGAGEGVPLVVCTGDQPAALHADGAADAETAVVNIGTGAFVLRPVGHAPVADDGLLCSVLGHDAGGVRYALEGTVNGAGAALAHVGREHGLDLGAAFSRADVALGADRHADGPLFLNGIGGLGAPWWNAAFPTRFLGAGSEDAHLAAVLESIVFLLGVNLERTDGHVGPSTRIAVSGGVSASDALCRNLASIAGCPVDRTDDHEATARGVAFLAAGAPDTWRPRARDERFPPVRDRALAGRYAAWRAAMDDAGRPRRA